MNPEFNKGIWGNTECAQCGACCYEWNEYLFRIEARKTPQCKNFLIEDGKSYCLAHNKQREPICENYFCGKTDACFRYEGDKKLREIAVMLGTVPNDK